MQRRCSLEQEAVERKHLPSSSNCCQLWKRGVDTVSKPEAQQGCCSGLNFDFCSPKKSFRLRSRGRTDPGSIPQVFYEQVPKQTVLSTLSSLTLLSDLACVSFTIASHSDGAWSSVPFFKSHRGTVAVWGTIFCLHNRNKVGRVQKASKSPQT